MGDGSAGRAEGVGAVTPVAFGGEQVQGAEEVGGGVDCLAYDAVAGWGAGSLFAPAFLVKDRVSGVVEVVGGNGVGAQEHDQGDLTSGEREGVGEKEAGGGPTPQQFLIVDGGASIPGEDEAAAGAADESESLGECADLVQVVKLVLGAGKAVQAEVPPSKIGWRRLARRPG